jgi:hypothetical protein
MGKMSTFWNIKKVFTQWDNAQEKAKEVFLNCFICANGYIIYPICTQWVYLGKRYICTTLLQMYFLKKDPNTGLQE